MTQQPKIKWFLHHHTAPTPLFWLNKRLDYAKAWADDRHAQGKRASFIKLWLILYGHLLNNTYLTVDSYKVVMG